MKTRKRFFIFNWLRPRGTAIVAIYSFILPKNVLSADNDSTMILDLPAVGIEADIRKDNTINPMIYGCGRSFIPSEAGHYAGALDDPARMARSYAGVQSLNDSRNDLAVRGNSPSSLLWRIDGFEIDNPHHFSTVGLTGSTVTLLNTDLMTQSDFITSAFPAEYGNTVGGIFDIHLKKAGAERFQYKFGMGWNGFEGCVESPLYHFHTKYGSVQGGLLCCYRYSFLDVMAQLGLQRGNIPKYQDLTVKSDVQINSRWNYSLLYLQGKSQIELVSNPSPTTKQNILSGSDIHFLGNRLEFGYDGRTSLSLAYSISKTQSLASLDTSFHTIKTLLFSDQASELKQSVSLQLKHHDAHSFVWKAGLGMDHYRMNMIQQECFSTNRMDTSLWAQTGMALSNAYVQTEYPLSSRFRMRGGLHARYLNMNHSYSIEPRFAVLWRMSDRHKISAAYGRHSQTQIHSLYFYGLSGENRQLGLSHARHINLSHNYTPNGVFRVKTDFYWQSMTHIPVEDNQYSSFSAVNLGNDFYVDLRDHLVNAGEAQNYGFELTAERFLYHHWYALANVSLFRSWYKGGDMKWRPSVYDLKHILNLTGGYEWTFNDRTTFRSDIRITHTGGRPYTPADEKLSKLAGYEIPDETKANLARYPAYFRLDWKLTVASLWFHKIQYDFSIDLQNLTNRHNILYKEYHPLNDCYVEYYQTLLYPMYTLRIRW